MVPVIPTAGACPGCEKGLLWKTIALVSSKLRAASALRAAREEAQEAEAGAKAHGPCADNRPGSEYADADADADE